MTIEELKSQGLIVLECISGSRAYGLATADSDTDIKGVFILPKEAFYKQQYIPQVSNETNDIVYYELGRFIELLDANNPNILELLNSPEDCILYKDPHFNELEKLSILSQKCANTFGRYAISQIKKARGLNKKIVKPFERERKSILSFCYVSHQQGSIPVNDYLKAKALKADQIGLAKVSHMNNVYGMYHDPSEGYSGLITNENATELSLSSISKEATPIALLYYNKDAYSSYCKEYSEYWNWVENRNEARYQSTLKHAKGYDAKNMMHVIRLLEMAIELAETEKIKPRRPNRDFLLKVKSGHFKYEEILAYADEKKQSMISAFENSSLPLNPDHEALYHFLYQFREDFYHSKALEIKS